MNVLCASRIDGVDQEKDTLLFKLCQKGFERNEKFLIKICDFFVANKLEDQLVVLPALIRKSVGNHSARKNNKNVMIAHVLKEIKENKIIGI